MGEKKETNQEEEIQSLKAQLAKKEMELKKSTFLDTAPTRIEDLEKAVANNRDYLLNFNERLLELEQNIVGMLKKK